MLLCFFVLFRIAVASMTLQFFLLALDGEQSFHLMNFRKGLSTHSCTSYLYHVLPLYSEKKGKMLKQRKLLYVLFFLIFMLFLKPNHGSYKHHTRVCCTKYVTCRRGCFEYIDHNISPVYLFKTSAFPWLSIARFPVF